jgi:glycosyltransferase involved in cell wall biosynthesis
VIATRNRCVELLATLARLRALPECPPIVVADNASSDGTPEAVRERHPDVELLALGDNRGAAARNAAARGLATPYLALTDDDAWWEPGALRHAAEVLRTHPRLGLLAARVLVGPREERLLAGDLVGAGWLVRYDARLVARHWPSANGKRAGRVAQTVRNDLWSAWLRRAARSLPVATVHALADGGAGWQTLRGTAAALRGLPWILRERRPNPREVERAMRTLERGRRAR